MIYGLDVEIIKEHKKTYWTFSNFIKYQGFDSLKQYDFWLTNMNDEDKLSTRWYYTSKYLELLKILA